VAEDDRNLFSQAHPPLKLLFYVFYFNILTLSHTYRGDHGDVAHQRQWRGAAPARHRHLTLVAAIPRQSEPHGAIRYNQN